MIHQAILPYIRVSLFHLVVVVVVVVVVVCPKVSVLSFFEIVFFLIGCSSINMYLSWYLLFESPFSKDAVYMNRMIFYTTFLYYQLFNLFCGPTLIALF